MRTLIHSIGGLAITNPSNLPLLKGAAMKDWAFLPDAFLIIENGEILEWGTGNPGQHADKTIDASGRLVLPAFCDSHTHIVYAGSREDEFVMKIQGRSYEEIAAAGGGILHSAEKLNQTTEAELLDQALPRLSILASFGVGAVEIKSGYGLSVAGELKMLRVIQQLKTQTRQAIKATFLGAHAIPAAYKSNRAGYIHLLINNLLPVVAGEGLADFIDVFCDTGFFTVAETDQILDAGVRLGLQPKIHANELDFSGGIEVGIRHNARSVDHLECTGQEQIQALLASQTMPTVLPSTAFFLGLPFAPARRMIDAGLPVALATDFNPGSSPSGNMPFVLSLACIKMKMLPQEALVAATQNGAYAMGLENNYGSIHPQKKAALIITKPMSSFDFLPYSFGHNPVETLILP
jgi:imidazolonepropionase